MTSPADNPALTRVIADLRRADPDRFGASLLAPPALRPRLWALYALNLQAAAAPFATAEPMLAEMRLQYWLDQLDDLGAGRRVDRHDVLDLLAAHWGQDAAALRDLVAARLQDCQPRPFLDASGVVDYVDATAGAVMRHAAQVLGAGGDEPAIAAQARGAGLAAWLVARPALQAQGRGLYGADAERLAGLAGQGLAALDAARAARRSMPRSAAPALFAGSARQVLRAHLTAPLAPDLPSDSRRRLKLALFSLHGRW